LRNGKVFIKLAALTRRDKTAPLVRSKLLRSLTRMFAMPERIKFTSHDEYIASAPGDVQKILLQIQAVVEASLPNAQRCISYNMPAYRDGKVFFYFAGFKNHLGIYPPVRENAPLIAELEPYRNAKGNLAFAYKKPIPYELICRVAVALANEYAQKQ
jgi:uncharacterized protein YdhG (YjbR/CyaY superfamily)